MRRIRLTTRRMAVANGISNSFGRDTPTMSRTYRKTSKSLFGMTTSKTNTGIR
jgi:hypothetical protein